MRLAVAHDVPLHMFEKTCGIIIITCATQQLLDSPREGGPVLVFAAPVSVLRRMAIVAIFRSPLEVQSLEAGG